MKRFEIWGVEVDEEVVDCRAESLATVEGKGDLDGAKRENGDWLDDGLVESASACFDVSKGFKPSEAEAKGFGLLADCFVSLSDMPPLVNMDDDCGRVGAELGGWLNGSVGFTMPKGFGVWTTEAGAGAGAAGASSLDTSAVLVGWGKAKGEDEGWKGF